MTPEEREQMVRKFGVLYQSGAIPDGGVITITPTEQGLQQRVRQAQTGAIETLNRRINALGTAESTVVPHGRDRILIQSRAFTSNIERYAGDSGRVRYFPGWAESIFQDDLENLAPAPELAAFRGTFNVLFAGNIGDAQDFPAILDAAEATRARNDIRWIIVGDGRAAEYVRGEIERRALQDKVVMLGRYPIERMPSFFRAVGALLVTLRADPIFSLTIPGKVQSYLGAGVPILGMLDGEGAKIIEQAGAGLVCPAGQGRALAERAVQMADMSLEDRAAMGARGRQFCRREFDRAKLVDSLEKWVDELRQERGNA